MDATQVNPYRAPEAVVERGRVPSVDGGELQAVQRGARVFGLLTLLLVLALAAPMLLALGIAINAMSLGNNLGAGGFLGLAVLVLLPGWGTVRLIQAATTGNRARLALQSSVGAAREHALAQLLQSRTQVLWTLTLAMVLYGLLWLLKSVAVA